MPSLSEQQLNALNKIRLQVSDVVPKHNLEDDRYLLRWLRARNFNVPKTEEMIRASMQWRKKHDMSNFLKNYKIPEVVQKYYPVRTIGFSKKGDLVWIINIGSWDAKGMFKCLTKSDMTNLVIYLIESSVVAIEENNMKHSLDAERFYMIVDTENLVLRQMACKGGMDFVSQLVRVSEANYPERLEKFMSINANKLYLAGFTLIKPFLNDVTLRKLNFFAQNDKSWKDVLLQDIDAAVLPVHWGGTRTDPDGHPKCPNLVPLGGDIPKDMYLNAEKSVNSFEGPFETIVVDSGKTAIVQADVEIPGSFLRWMFATDKHDIAFSLHRKTAGGHMVEHLPIGRVDCHEVPEEGELECLEKGAYILSFDNSHSLVRKKTLRFRIEVIPPS